MSKNSNKGNQHVTPRGNLWTVTGAGNSRATAVVSTQREAINIAKPIASNQSGDVIYTEEMDKFESVIATEMIHSLLKVKFYTPYYLIVGHF